MSDEQATASRDAVKQARHREGVKATLNRIEERLAEQQGQLAALVELLAVELQPPPTSEQRR